MKKILALVLALCMVFALCACGQAGGRKAPRKRGAAASRPCFDATEIAPDTAVKTADL